jgi:hypothetical protein
MQATEDLITKLLTKRRPGMFIQLVSELPVLTVVATAVLSFVLGISTVHFNEDKITDDDKTYSSVS